MDGEPSKYQQVKIHIQKYKREYIIGGSSLTVGIAIGVLLKTRPTQIINTVAPEIKPVFEPVFNNTISNNLGPCCKIVQDIDNPEELWPKVTTLAEHLAEEHGASVDAVRKMLSRHFRGELETVFGKRYRPYGVTTTG